MRLLALLFISFIGCSFASAKSTLELVQDLGVSNLEGNVTVYYSADSQTSDISFTQKLVENAIDFFGASPEINTHLKIYPAILNRGDWQKMPMGLAVPYGIPSVSEDFPFVAFIGATDDNILTEFNFQMENLLPQQYKDAINHAGFSYPEAAHTMPFLVAIHEMGHAYLQVKGLGYPKSQTYSLEEVLANYFLYAFLRTKHPDLAKVWDNILEVYVMTQCPTHTTIKDFDDLYFGVTQAGGIGNFFWYQGMFQRIAKALFESEGLGFVTKMDEIVNLGNMADPKLVYQKLIALTPAFKEWIENFRPDSHCL